MKMKLVLSFLSLALSGLPITSQACKASTSAEINFPPMSTALTQKAQDELQKAFNLAILTNTPNQWNIAVHTRKDETSSLAARQEMTHRRERAIHDWLIQRGVPKEKINAPEHSNVSAFASSGRPPSHCTVWSCAELEIDLPCSGQ